MSRAQRLDQPGREAILSALTQNLAARPDVSFALVFGSFLRPEPFHDIDVAVWLNEGAERRADLDLAVRLTRAARYPVDVRIANRAPTAFLFNVLRGRPLVVNDERLFADLIERTARLYHDQAPLVRRATRDAFAA